MHAYIGRIKAHIPIGSNPIYTTKFKNMKRDELIVSIVLIAICVLGIVAMMFRSEQIDTKKELPVAIQSNSANF